MRNERQITLFGPPTLTHLGHSEPIFRAAKTTALLGYLTHQRVPVPRTELTALLWGETTDYRSRRNLTHALGMITARLPDCVVADQHTVNWQPEAVLVDVVECAALLHRAKHLPPHQAERSAQADLLERVVQQYQGELLVGVSLDDCPEFDRWLISQRERWREQIVGALIQLSAHYRAAAQDAAAERTLRQWVALEPWQEEAHRALMQLLAELGRRVDALHQFDRCCQLLTADLQIAPTAETVALADLIRNDQIAVRAHPAVATQGRPRSIAPRIGRDAELKTLLNWMDDRCCRIVTITGFGGVGKTTLADMLARELAARGTPVVWCSLLNIPPLADVVRRCARALGADPAATLPEDEPALVQLLLTLLSRRALIVLDNAESLLEPLQKHYRASASGYALLLSALTTEPHHGLVLITSRTVLPELAAPPNASAAVNTLALGGLLEQHAVAWLARSDLAGTPAAYAALASHYDGIPLALELVSAQIRDLFGAQVDALLAAGVPIFGGIRNLLDQQSAQLSPLEQQVLLWFAVERFTVNPARLAAQLAHLARTGAVLDALDRLVRRSFIVQDRDGLRPQHVVLEYATDQLIERMTADIVQRQLTHVQTHPLLLAGRAEHVRAAQTRMLLAPLTATLLAQLGHAGLTAALVRLLGALRDQPPQTPGFGAANLIHLAIQAGIDLEGFCFDGLCIWQADLRRATLPHVSLVGADVRGSLFADTFARPLSVALHPSGELLAAGTSDGEVRLWRTQGWQPERVLRSGSIFVAALAWSPDGEHLAANGPDHELWLWHVADEQPLVRLSGHTHYVYAAAYAPSGALLASASHDGTVRLWHAITGRCWQCLEHGSPVWTLAFAPDGATVASGGFDQLIRIWQTHTGRLLHRLAGHTGKINAVAYAPDGSLLASAGVDLTIIVWDLASAAPRIRLNGHTGVVHALVFSPDGRLLASASDDRSVRLWDLTSGRTIARLDGHTDFVRSLAFRQDGRVLFSCGGDGTVRMWEVTEARLVETVYGYIGMLLAATWTADSIVCGGADGKLHRWSSSGSNAAALLGHHGWVRALATAPDSASIASGGDDQIVRLWDAARGTLRATFHGHTDAVCALAFSPDGQLLASGSQDLTIRLWDVASGQLRATIRRHAIRVRALCFAPDGRTLASADTNGLIALWDVSTAAHLRDWHGHSGWVSALVSCPRTGAFVSAGLDQVLRVWEADADEPVLQIVGHTSAINAVAVSEDSTIIVSASSDQTIRIWDRQSGTPRETLAGHRSGVMALALSPRGLLASVDVDGRVRLWDLARGQQLTELAVAGPYVGMEITDTSGLSPAQQRSLHALGACGTVQIAPLRARTTADG